MVSKYGKNAFFDDGFFEKLKGRTNGHEHAQQNKQIIKNAISAVDVITKSARAIVGWDTTGTDADMLADIQKPYLVDIRKSINTIRGEFGKINSTYVDQTTADDIKLFVLHVHQVIKKMINIKSLVGCTSTDAINAFYPEILKVKDFSRYADAAIKDFKNMEKWMDDLIRYVNDIRSGKITIEGCECPQEEDSVGTLLPVAKPDKILIKKECGPSAEEAFDALAPIMEAASSNPKLNMGKLRSIEAWAFRTYKDRGYVQYRDMNVGESQVNRKRDNVHKKVTVATAKIKNKAVCSVEFTKSQTTGKNTLETVYVSPEFALSGWIASIYLLDKYGLITSNTNAEIENIVKEINSNKYSMRDETILEEYCSNGSPFVYDESGTDIMPFTTNITLVSKHGEFMVEWINSNYSDVDTEPLEMMGLRIIEDWVSSTYVGLGYIPMDQLDVISKEDGGGVCTTISYENHAIAEVSTCSVEGMKHLGVYISTDFTLTGFIAVVHTLSATDNRIDRRFNAKLRKYAHQIAIGTFIKCDRFIQDPVHEYDLLKTIDNMVRNTEELVEVWGESWDDTEIYTEAAKIDGDIKDIISILNTKGYKTIYSCSGHPSAKLKSDVYKDGVKDGKIYSTARIVFDKKYDFGGYPTGWEPKDLDDGKFGIYVKGPSYHIVKGVPKEQFYRWKKRYMYHLEKWVSSLPEVKKGTESDTAAKKRYAEKGI